MTTSKRVCLSKMVVALAMGLMVLAPLGAAIDSSRASVDLRITSSNISVSPGHPNVGDVVKITAFVENEGSNPASADVLFWDVSLGKATLIGATQNTINANDRSEAYVTWNTTGVRSGFHDIWVQVNSVDDVDDHFQDNNATLQITITNPEFSQVVSEGYETMHDYWLMTDILGVWGTGRLTLENAIIQFYQSYDYQYGIVVDEQGVLTLKNTIILSNYQLRILVGGTSVLNIEPGCDVFGKIITRNRAQVNIAGSTLTGGLEVQGGNFTLSGSALSNGSYSFLSTNATLDSSSFTSNKTFKMDSSVMRIKDTVFTILYDSSDSPAVDSLNVTGSSSVSLTAVVTGSINVQDAASVFIYRYVTMHAEDTSGLSVPGATLNLKNNYGWTAYNPPSKQTDRYGDATFTVLTDFIMSGPTPKAIGTYNITGMWGSNDQAQTNIQMPSYPTMDAASNSVHKTLIFQPIFYITYAGDEWGVNSALSFSSVEGAGNLTKSCDIYVNSTFTLNNYILYIEQPSDYYCGIYVYPTGKIIIQGGGIISNHKLNVYIIGQGSIVIAPTKVMNGVMTINALIGLEDETHARGSFQATNIDFTGSLLGTFKQLKFDVSAVVPHSYNTITGALAFTVDNGDINNATINAPPPSGTASNVLVDSTLKFSNCNINIPRFPVNGTTVSFGKCALSGWYYDAHHEYTYAGSILNLSAGTLTIVECTIDYEALVINAQTLISTSTDYDIPLEFKGSNTGLLTNVHAPQIFVNDSAEVVVQWILTMRVYDYFHTPVEGADVQVLNFTTGQPMPGGLQTTGSGGTAVFVLKAKTMYSRDVVFVGNYKVKVTKVDAVGTTHSFGPKDISMRENVDLDVNLEGYMNVPQRLDVKIDHLSAYNLTEDQTAYAYGSVTKIYKGGHSEIASEFPLTLSFDNTPVTYNGTTDSEGLFNISFKAPPPAARNITLTVSGNWSTAGTGRDSVFNIIVPVPRPDGLRITISGFDHADRKYLKGKEYVNVTGFVELMVGTRSLGTVANLTVLVSVDGFTKQGQTDATGSFRINLGKFNSKGEHGITVTSSYTDAETNKTLTGQTGGSFLVYPPPTPKKAEIPIMWIIIIVVIIVGAVGGAAFLWYKMQSEAAKLVECGECGAFIPENALKCPKCNTEFETEVVKCSECGAWIPSAATDCPKCGITFKKKAPPTAASGKGAVPSQPGQPAQGPPGPAAQQQHPAPPPPPPGHK